MAGQHTERQIEKTDCQKATAAAQLGGKESYPAGHRAGIYRSQSSAISDVLHDRCLIIIFGMDYAEITSQAEVMHMSFPIQFVQSASKQVDNQQLMQNAINNSMSVQTTARAAVPQNTDSAPLTTSQILATRIQSFDIGSKFASTNRTIKPYTNIDAFSL